MNNVADQLKRKKLETILDLQKEPDVQLRPLTLPVVDILSATVHVPSSAVHVTEEVGVE